MAVPGPIYSATYNGMPIYELRVKLDRGEQCVLRRRKDNWINATHIINFAGLAKPTRRKMLRNYVRRGCEHEKKSGGNIKAQGTWIPLEIAKELAERCGIYDRIRPLFEYVKGDESLPAAPGSKPKHKPKANRRAGNNTLKSIQGDESLPAVPKPKRKANRIAVPTNKAPLMPEDDPLDGPCVSTSMTEDDIKQKHAEYGDELLYYLTVEPVPPPNFNPDRLIYEENNTALHWASAIGNIHVITQLKRSRASLSATNIRGETPFMHSVNYTNCYEKKVFPAVMGELFETAGMQDDLGCTIIHHAATMKNHPLFDEQCSSYYLNIILDELEKTLAPSKFQELLDTQDEEGNTALHLAAQKNYQMSIDALLRRDASPYIPNNEGVYAKDLIEQLDTTEKLRGSQRSLSPCTTLLLT